MKLFKRSTVVVIGLVLLGIVGIQVRAHDQIDYIMGRKLTQEEIAAQKEHEPELRELPDDEYIFAPMVRRNRNVIPEFYDARQDGLVTPVKEQGDWGCCWSFAAISCAETSAIKKGIIDNPDFSEHHLTYFFYNRVDDPLNNTAGDKNIAKDRYLNNGGNVRQAAIALSGWTGVAKEELAPYSPYSMPSVPDDQTAYQNSVTLRNAYFLSSDLEETKSSILEYGSVAIMYYHDDTYMNYDTAAYSYAGTATGTNHAVTIVGWDDHYNCNNFLEESGVSGNGAWIVKNSWGEDWGDAGYFYLSYEDPSIRSRSVFEVQPNDRYHNNYQYDGNTISTYSELPTGGSIANVFEVKKSTLEKNEILKAVGFLLYSPNIDYSIQIYKNLVDDSNPVSGTPCLEKPVLGRTGNAGIYTVDLNQEIQLLPEETYSIVITLNSSDDIYYGIEYSEEYNWISYEAEISPQESFVYDGEGTGWTDLSQYNKCARIKGYTVDGEKTTISVQLNPETMSLEVGERSSLEAIVMPEEFKDKLVWTSSDCEIIEVEEGNLFAKQVGTVTVTASIGDVETSCVVSVKPKKVTGLTALSKGKNKVLLSWDNVEGAEGYLIYAHKLGKYGYCGMTTRGTTFTDVNAMDSDYNYYWVFPYVKDAEGKMITGGCDKYVFAKGVCPAVTNLRASSVTGGVKLTWTKSAGAEGYLIYGQVAGNKYGYVGMTTKGTTYADKKASKAVYNYYWVFPYHKDANGKMIVGGTAKYTYGRAK